MTHPIRTTPPTRSARLIGAAALALLLAACATTSGTTTGGGKAAQSKASPEVRALERWKLLIAGKAGEAWDYLSPGARSTKTREAYAAEMSQRPIRWETVESYEKPVCEADDACTVKILVTYSVDVPLPNVGLVTSPSVLEEKWIALDGVWYHVPADISRR